MNKRLAPIPAAAVPVVVWLRVIPAEKLSVVASLMVIV